MALAKQRRVAVGWTLVALALLLGVSCARSPVRDELTIEFSQEDDSVVVTADTFFDLRPGNDVAQGMAVTAREAALSGTDQWAVRFTRVEPETERLVLDRTGGVLERITRSARIPAKDLQQFLSDTTITVARLRGDDWQELSLYTGTGQRASREQIKRFDGELQAWSGAVARYYRALAVLYDYCGAHPQRARYLFAYLLREQGSDGAEPVVTRDEEPLVGAVTDAMEEIVKRLDLQEDRAETLAGDADAIFNPFPARITVRVPGEILASEGFPNAEGNLAIIEQVNLFTTISELEGRWAEPDPLSALLSEETPLATELAEMPRRATPGVGSSEVHDAVRERLTRPRTYRVRWRG